MWKDEILEEMHKYREEYARSFDYNLDAIFNDLQKKQNAHKERVVTLPIKQNPKLIERIGQQTQQPDAEELFQQGNEKLDRGDFQGATLPIIKQ